MSEVLKRDILKPVVLVPDLGEQAVLPDGAIINAGGVSGPNFTVGDKAVILADGTASDGSGPVISVGNSVLIGYEHVQAEETLDWVINHGKGTRKIQLSIWDEENELLFSEQVKIVDHNTVHVKFNSPQSGRAVMILFS